MNHFAAFAILAIALSGCSNAPLASDIEPEVVEYRVRLAEFADGSGVTTIEEGSTDAKWGSEIQREATPRDADPADYGANAKGEYWQDTIIEAKSYVLDAGAVITTHTHGVVIIATESITIDGRINARGLGAGPGEPG